MNSWDFMFLRFCIGTAMTQARTSLVQGDILDAMLNLGRADGFLNQGINGGFPAAEHAGYFRTAHAENCALRLLVTRNADLMGDVARAQRRHRSDFVLR